MVKHGINFRTSYKLKNFNLYFRFSFLYGIISLQIWLQKNYILKNFAKNIVNMDFVSFWLNQVNTNCNLHYILNNSFVEKN